MGGSGQRVKGVGRALHVVGRRLQGVRRRRGAVEDVDRPAEAVGGRVGPGRVGLGRTSMGGTCRSHGNVGIVSEKLQFRVKTARGENLWRRLGCLGKDWGCLGKDGILWAKSEFSWAKKNAS